MVGSRRCNHEEASFISSAMSPWWRLLFLIASIPMIGVSDGQVMISEGDALSFFRQGLTDSNNVLQSWVPFTTNPCAWFHVTCNAENSVVRLDLGNAGLSGRLAPELGLLQNLQYLELYRNNFSGPIPQELGNLTNLVSLDLYQNSLTGIIPDSLGQISSLRFLRLNNNSLSGSIPFSLTTIPRLQMLDMSYNDLSGEVPSNGSFNLFTPISFAGNVKLCGALLGKQCPGQPPFSPLPPYTPPPGAQSNMSPSNQGSKNRKVIILASTIFGAVLVFLIVGFTFMVCRKTRNQKTYSQDLQKRTKLAAVQGPRI